MPGLRWRLRAAAALIVGVGSVLALVGTAAAEDAATDPPASPPGIPSGVTLTAGDGNVVVSWIAPASDGGDTISGYTVTSDPGGFTASVPGVARSATVTGLTNGVNYRFTVVASNSEGKGPESAVSGAVAPTPGAGVAGPPLISEDFSTSAGRMTPVSGGTWGVASGRYVLSAPADDGEAVANANLAVEDVVVDGDFTLTASASTAPTSSVFNDFSIVFDFRDPANYYFASFCEGNDANTSGIFRVADGVRTQLADITTPIAAGTVYPVRVERQGPAIRVFRSGDRVATATDATFTAGKVGFGSRNDGGTFDDLVVTGPAAPPPAAPAPPTGFLAQLWDRVVSLFSG